MEKIPRCGNTVTELEGYQERVKTKTPKIKFRLENKNILFRLIEERKIKATCYRFFHFPDELLAQVEQKISF